MRRERRRALPVQASEICKLDPLICNELGVLYFSKRDYKVAAAWLRRAAALLTVDRMSPTWQPVLANLGHAHRKLGEYDEAITAFTRALGLAPHDAGTFAALALTHHLRGDLGTAIETYHRSLAFRPDCAVTQELLRDALQEHCTHCCLHDDPGLM
jgi:anaphase-promoting complex subunit 6